MIAYSISGWGQAPEKVTSVDLFYLCSMDQRTTNIPHLLALLAQYLLGQQGVDGVRERAGLGSPYETHVDYLHEGLGASTSVTLQELSESITTDRSRFSNLVEFTCITQLMDANGHTYQAFDRTLVGSSQMPYQRRVRPKTGDASTFTAPHTDA
ncbi:hypothetical protein Tco_0761343 [Tanacetum coccineum]